MKLDRLTPVLNKLNQEYKGNKIKGLQYPIDFYIIAPKRDLYGSNQIIDRFWHCIDVGVPLDELMRSVGGLDLTIYAKNKNDIRNDFFPLEDKLIHNISANIIGYALLEKIERALGREILKNEFLTITYNEACEKLYGTTINSLYIPDICNENDTFCFLYQEWKSHANLLLEMPEPAPHVSINYRGLEMPISQGRRKHAIALFEEIDLKCGFESFDIMDHVPSE